MHGFIYFHRIRDARVGEAVAENIRMFFSLCGVKAMTNVAIVTTRWDDLQGEKQLQDAQNKEAELRDRYFKEFISNEAQVHRHNNTVKSAEIILSSLLRLPPIGDIQLVFEIVSGKSLPQTGAGLELERLVQLVRYFEGEIKRLVNDVQANTVVYQKEIAKLKADLAELQQLAEKKRKMPLLQRLFRRSEEKTGRGAKY